MGWVSEERRHCTHVFIVCKKIRYDNKKRRGIKRMVEQRRGEERIEGKGQKSKKKKNKRWEDRTEEGRRKDKVKEDVVRKRRKGKMKTIDRRGKRKIVYGRKRSDPYTFRDLACKLQEECIQKNGLRSRAAIYYHTHWGASGQQTDRKTPTKQIKQH